LGRKIFARLTPNNGCCEDETLKRTQPNAIDKSSKVKIPKTVPLPKSNTVPESISKEWVTRKTLRFLNEKPESEGS
jgi:hypothetical protein